VLQEAARLIGSNAYRLCTCRPDLRDLTDRRRLRLPRASIYVVDTAPHTQNACYLVSEILARFPRAKVLVLCEKVEEVSAFAFLQLGAVGLLRHSELETRLLDALASLCAGEFWASRRILSRFVERTIRSGRRPVAGPPAAALSRREREIFDLLVENLANKEIAARLHVSLRTVKFHVSRLLAKYGVRGRADLVLMRSA
jgi:DNA-binding NarL/FixJ family response regulator